MKVIVLTNSDILSINTIQSLNESGNLAGVGILKKNKSKLTPALKSLGLKDTSLLELERQSWVEVLKDFINKNEVDYVWVLTFPWIIPTDLLSALPNAFVNFHFGLLPKYKGSDPIFWQLKNREELGGVTIHLMNEKIDEGPFLLKQELRIIPGENYGLHCKRLGEMVPPLIDQLFTKLRIPADELTELDFSEAQYDKPPKIQDLTIRWNEQTAEEIEWLVNATNPKYSGANTSIAGFEMRILEVTPVNMEASVEAEPGQIVHADVVYGLVVACLNKEYLRVTVVQTAEGYLSGIKLFNLGFTAGHKFIS